MMARALLSEILHRDIDVAGKVLLADIAGIDRDLFVEKGIVLTWFDRSERLDYLWLWEELKRRVTVLALSDADTLLQMRYAP